MATRQSKQMQRIVELLASTDYDKALFAACEYGMFSITHIAAELNPDVYYTDIPASRISSIYRTLATLVERGQVVKHPCHHTGGFERLPTISYTYHLKDKLQDDLNTLKRISIDRKARSEEALKRFLG